MTNRIMRNRTGTRAMICTAAIALSGAALSAQRAAAPSGTRIRPAATPVSFELSVPQPDRERRFEFPHPIVRVGQGYTVRADEVVNEVTAVLGDVTIEGRVDNDVIVVLGTLKLASTAVVQGSVVVVGGSAVIDEGATIRQDLAVVGGPLTAPPGFSPQGVHVAIGTEGIANALRGAVPWVTRGLLWGRLIVPGLQWVWVVVGILFLVYLALNIIFDHSVRACADTLLERPLSAFMLGLLVLLLTIPALAIVAASIVGLAIVPFLLCGLFVGALVGNVGVTRAIGRRLVRETSDDSRLQSFRSLLIGFVVLCLAYMVPVLGLMTWALAGVLGLGAAAATFRAAIRREHPPRERAVPAVAVAEPQAAGAYATPHIEVTPPPLDAASLPVDAAPPPAPAGPRAAGDLAIYPRAGFLDRTAAFALDCVLVAIAVQLLDLSRHDGSFPLLLLAYHVAFWAWRGTTLGGIIVGLRIVRVDGTELRFVDALVRGLAGVFSIVALGIGYFWMLQDPERQTWHDKIAGTLVVKVPRHLVLP